MTAKEYIEKYKDDYTVIDYNCGDVHYDMDMGLMSVLSLWRYEQYHCSFTKSFVSLSTDFADSQTAK